MGRVHRPRSIKLSGAEIREETPRPTEVCVNRRAAVLARFQDRREVSNADKTEAPM
jgi:hypothetical protein